jgi:hypothetical protein
VNSNHIKIVVVECRKFERNNVQCHIHQRAVAVGDKIPELYDLDPSDLAAYPLPLAMCCDVVLPVHAVITYAGVSASGDSVFTQ